MSAKKTPHKNQEKNSSSPLSINTFFLLSFLALSIITTAIYYRSLNNQFTNWDDNRYIIGNANIQTFHGDSLSYTFKKIISSYEQGNYHPLTMLTYCLEYEKFKLNPKPYHLTNFILHLLNTLLVFCFIWLLTKQKWVAFITSILFAIHPMHVESVSWVSERKDVLYSFFYLAALCTYIFYLQKEKKKGLFYALTFLLFIFSVLSKAMAVSLPIAFFAVDYFLDRKFTFKNVLEKIPFLIVSLVFGFIAILAQKSGNAMDDSVEYNFFDRILFSSYGLMTYLWKLIAPVNLSCFYKYPVKTEGLYPLIFYIAPVIMLSLVFWVYRSKQFGKDVIFGFGFFLITIVMVLQILPVGAAIIADRYTYLPYIGIFFIIARWINNLLENNSDKIKSLKIPFLSVFILFLILCCYLSFQRSKVWYDSISLWSDAIKKDDSFPLPFNSRGDAYFLKEDYNQAIPDFSHAIQLKYQTPDIYYKRGMAYYHLQKYEEAIKDFTEVIHRNNNFPDAYYSRGLAYYNFGKFDEAIKDFTIEIRNNPNSGKVYNDRGVAYDNQGKFEDAIKDYTDAIQHNPSFMKAYFNRGNVYYNHGKFNEAIQDYNSVIQLSPTFAQAYNNRGSAYGNLGKNEEAIKDYTSAIQYSLDFSSAYNNRARAYSNIKKFQLALEDALKAKQLGFAVDPIFIEQIRLAIKK